MSIEILPGIAVDLLFPPPPPSSYTHMHTHPGIGITPLADAPTVPIHGLAAGAETEVTTETEAAGVSITGGSEKESGTTREAVAVVTLEAGRGGGGTSVAGVIHVAGTEVGEGIAAEVCRRSGGGRGIVGVTRGRERGGGEGAEVKIEMSGVEATH